MGNYDSDNRALRATVHGSSPRLAPTVIMGNYDSDNKALPALAKFTMHTDMDMDSTCT